jgi:ubiquinone/menaquinone biosynthesis C-methylase UbiE
MDYIPHVRSKRRKVHRTLTVYRQPRGRQAQDDDDPTTASICAAYSVEGYDSMNLDLVRNRFFRKAIRAAARARPGAQWVEVGCGASALLTRMVLDEDPLCCITAFEINSAATALARRRLRENPAYTGRWMIVNADAKDTTYGQVHM